MKSTLFAELGDFDEDKRITLIGEATSAGKTVAFVVDDDPGTADRYISKLKTKFPGIVILGRFAGPVKKTVMIKVCTPYPAGN